MRDASESSLPCPGRGRELGRLSASYARVVDLTRHAEGPYAPAHLFRGSMEVGVMSERSAKEVVGEMFRRQEGGDDTALDDLVAADMVNHAAGPRAARA